MIEPALPTMPEQSSVMGFRKGEDIVGDGVESEVGKKEAAADRNINLGRIEGKFRGKEILTEEELGHHVHVVGASGYGKTVLLGHIIKARIEAGAGMLFIDLKGEMETVQKVRSWAAGVGRESDLQVFTLQGNGCPANPDGCVPDTKFKQVSEVATPGSGDQPLHISAGYNPLSSATPTQLRDRILQSLNWTEEYYKNQAGSFLLKLLIGLDYASKLTAEKLAEAKSTPVVIDLGTVLRATTDVDFLANMILLIPHSEIRVRKCLEDCFQILNTKDDYKSLQGLRTQLESLVLSDFGELLESGRERGINLFEAARSGKIVVMTLDSRRYGESAKSIGRFILQDLKAVSARIDSEIPKGERRPFSVIIDEFADLASEDFIGFLDRARSSKMSIVVAHQEISDLKRISPEFAARLTGNTSTLYAFLQKNGESAEAISSMAGTKKAWKETLRSQRFLYWNVTTGDKSLREVEEFMVHPNVIKKLHVGQCVVVKKYPSSRSYVVRVNRE